MSKEWVIKRDELEREPIFGKLHNPTKIKELDIQLEEVCTRAKSNDLVQKLCRKLIEEVVNIMQHDVAWNELSLQSKFSNNTDNFRFRFKYDGGNYYDPKNLDNVVGTTVTKFTQYLREPPEIDEDGNVTFRLQIKI